MNDPKELADLIKQPSQEVEEQEAQASPRTQARRVALQALYQWQVNQEEVYLIEKQFFEDGLLSNLDREWFRELLAQVSAESEQLDEAYVQFIDRSAKLINPVERTILRMATYELQTQMQIPYKVVINEAVELTKRFGAEDAHKYINGVLDKVAKKLRPVEFSV
ncbi:MAG: transcription antitermination factor NusB [Thiomicrospira sp.]|uniref:transcription antitermination factor NusB n=1 Tax=Thiomicrospira sp. TaxID=935 RepID=UPI0019FDC393|nr:transcription antitermination factor NusB [Thiomicrospira sp.]MBE0492972.1 transcription antitermination factor NusB [Thiomicrospira sp.]